MTGLISAPTNVPGAEGSQVSNPFGTPDSLGLGLGDITLPTNDYPLIPEGDYLARVKSLVATRSKRTKNPMLVAEFAIVGGEFDGVTGGKMYMVMTQDALWKLTEFCEATGLGAGGQSINIPSVLENAPNRLVTLQIIHNESEDGNRTFANPGTVSPPPQGAGTAYEAPTDGVPF